MIKRIEPNLPESLIRPSEPEQLVSRAALLGDDVEARLFEEAIFAGIEAERLEFVGCRFVRCDFSTLSITRLSFTDCVFERCDFSNFLFKKCSLMRVRFESCRLTGATFSDAALAHARFEDSLMRYAAFGKCKLRAVEFERCDMHSAAFHEVKHDSMALIDCKLAESEWVLAPLKGVDLSSCEIQGLRVGEGILRGAIVAAEQLLDLAALIGVEIKP